jgi:rhamnopyranosyl-N-acetylglucosaminyl-diphospho-decaprenol beta-1,3/1,4-galactofuranosyltransferase
MNDSKIAAVIPAFNGVLVLAECLDSLLKQSFPISKIYIIDNASSDDTASLMMKYQSTQVRYLRLKENIGPTGGFAKGMQSALDDGCDLVWLMDQDSTAQTDTLEKLVACMDSDASIVAVAPAKLGVDGQLWVGENLTGGVGADRSLYDGPPFDVESTLWSGLLVRASAIREAGLPLTELFGWWCDGEYCFRLGKHGRVVLVPESKIHHHRTGAVHLDFAGYWKHYYYQRNSMYLYLNGHLPSPGLPRMLSDLTKQVAYILLRQDHKTQRLHILLTAAVHAFSGRMGRGPAWLH